MPLENVTFTVTVSLPRSILDALGNVRIAEQALRALGIWPAPAHLRRWTIDPLTQAYVADLELPATALLTTKGTTHA